LKFFFEETQGKAKQAKQQGGLKTQEKDVLKFQLERIVLSLRGAFNEIIEK
jgi:hypothetical protein